VAAVYSFALSWAIIISEIISQCATWILLCDNGVMLFVDKLFVSQFVFYVVLFELMVKKIKVISFVMIIGAYQLSDAITIQTTRFVLLQKCGQV